MANLYAESQKIVPLFKEAISTLDEYDYEGAHRCGDSQLLMACFLLSRAKFEEAATCIDQAEQNFLKVQPRGGHRFEDVDALRKRLLVLKFIKG